MNGPTSAISVQASAYGHDGISVYPSYENATIYGFGIVEFTAVASDTGEKTVSIEVRALSGNIVTTKNISVSMLAVQGPGSLNLTIANKSFTGTISGRGQEKIDYYVSKSSQVDSVTYWSHCTYIGFFGGVLPEPQQCGTNTWGFDTGDSSCNVFAYDGDNRYYCFAIQGDSANASSVGQQFGYVYNITMHIANASLSLQVGLTNNATKGVLTNSNGGNYGYAMVTSVYGPDVYPVPYLSYAVLVKSNSMYPVNISRYSAYSNIYNQVTQLLSIYNSSGGADLGYLEGLITQLNKNASQLVNSQQVNDSACLLTSQVYPSYYSCATHDLSYNILVHLNGSQYSDTNKTFYIGSSTVKVIG